MEKNARFADKYSFPFDLLSDTERTVGLAYGATKEGATGGAARLSFLIDEDGKIARAYGKVNAGAHPSEVLAELG